MILRRLSQSLKEQNWIAICIEFVLLVAGVFLGIQVANWNQAQQDSQRSREIIKNLSTDYTEIAAQGEDNKKQLAVVIQSVDEALSIIREPQNIADGKVLSRKLDDIFNLPVALQESVTQQELIFSGHLGLVENDELRVMLIRNNARLIHAQKVQQSRREFVRPFTAPVMRLRMLLQEGYLLQQAFDLAGGKPDIQIGLRASGLIQNGELETLEQSLESLRLVRNKLEEQRAGGKKP